MRRHSIETCPDDRQALCLRFDELTALGSRVLAVLWQPRRPDPQDHPPARDILGSFVIVSESGDGVGSLPRPRGSRTETREFRS